MNIFGDCLLVQVNLAGFSLKSLFNQARTYLEDMIVSLNLHKVQDHNYDARMPNIYTMNQETLQKKAIDDIKLYSTKINHMKDKIQAYQSQLIQKQVSLKQNMQVRLLERFFRNLYFRSKLRYISQRNSRQST